MKKKRELEEKNAPFFKHKFDTWSSPDLLLK